MTDMVEKFNTFKKNLASESRARVNRRKDKLDDIHSGWEIGVGSNSKYRENWDRIFGRKTRDTIQNEGEK